MNNNEKLAKLAVHKSLLKEYSNSSNDRIVYMNNGTEFQIQVFNPYSYVIGVSFTFNENNYNNSNLLVLRPGERVWLDRYLNNDSKLLFSTYEVGNSKTVKEAIKENGKLTIRFYKEKEPQKMYINSPIYINTYEPYDKHYNYNDYSVTCNTALNTDSAANYCSTSLGLNSVNTSSAATCAATYSVGTATTYSYSDDNISTEKISSDIKFRNSIETGRIEKGSHSNQKFEYVNKDFEYWAFKTEYIKILPTSQKQINSNDLKKRYCHECGRKLNQKYKFCPYCGAEQ